MKNLNQNEVISVVAALGVIALVFVGSYGNPFVRVEEQGEQVSEGRVRIENSATEPAAAAAALADATDPVTGEITKLIIEDVTLGEGEPVVDGDIVTVHYVGVLRDGMRFDDSLARGEPFTFTVGAGTVIKGWDQGILGMKKGGERVVIIPSSLGYGDRQLGPIPPNSTLLFTIRLVEVVK